MSELDICKPAEKPTVLLVDDDPFMLEQVSSGLSDINVLTSLSSDIALQADLSNIDLIVLDVNLDGVCGLDVCSGVREKDCLVPVLIISKMLDLDVRLKAYGVGANDYISKPFQLQEFEKKCLSLISSYRKLVEMDEKRLEATDLFFSAQKGTYYVQVVNKFLQASSECKSLDNLFTLFFFSLNCLDVSGVLQVDSFDARSTEGSIRSLELEILTMSSKLSRIHQFGHGRALFNWSNCRFLARGVGAHIDTLAHLMDALEVSVARIESQDSLIRQMKEIESYNNLVQQSVSELFEMMTSSMSDAIVTLGIVSSLTSEEESAISNLLEFYKGEITSCFLEQNSYNKQLQDSIELMREPSERFREMLMEMAVNNARDEIELF
ncbi:MAG: response regulator [Pseudohongiellaceae bacterium]|nr:response regulator [Pseudohongiellaceae bacterium]